MGARSGRAVDVRKRVCGPSDGASFRAPYHRTLDSESPPAMPESMVVIVTEKELLGTQPRARHGSHRSRDGRRSPPKERPSLFDPPAHRDRRRAKGAKGARVPSSIRRPRRHVLSNSDRTILPPLPTKKAEASGAGGGSRRGCHPSVRVSQLVLAIIQQ